MAGNFHGSRAPGLALHKIPVRGLVIPHGPRDKMEREFDQQLVIDAYRRILGDIQSSSDRPRQSKLNGAL